MRWMRSKWMLGFAGLSLLLSGGCAHQQAVVGESYCAVYEPIIQKKGDASISASLAVKQRILYNEQMFRTECRRAKP